MSHLTYEEAKKISESGEYKIVPLSIEMNSDISTPIEVHRKLKNVSHHGFILESIEDNEKWGRYTFLGYDPKLEITCKDGKTIIKHNKTYTEETDHPNDIIRKILAEHKSPRLEDLPSFSGGLVGYFAYDYIKYSEPSLNLDAHDEEGFMDADLMLFDKVIAFDNFRQKIILIVNIKCDDFENEYERGMAELKKLKDIILYGVPQMRIKGRMTSELRSNVSEEEFCEIVEKAKEYIRNGDIFQVVLSKRLDADFEGSLLDSYRILRTTNPSPYMFYFSSNDLEISGASPETLVKLENGVLHTFPLAGTRPRGTTPEQDKELEASLLSDQKELAEHNMLVDLGRNDIGKISKFGSVKVEKYMDILKFSHVMHIGSTVSGEIRNNCDALDAVDAILPAGTLSGAPKIRACEIINELENCKRGIYGGAIGYIDFTGNLDTCIAIRIAYKKNGKVFIRSGAGIVADSVAKSEFTECTNKAMAVVRALEEAQGGLE